LALIASREKCTQTKASMTYKDLNHQKMEGVLKVANKIFFGKWIRDFIIGYVL
jgi:hypothetical protein